MRVLIIDRTEKPFKSDEGELISYFWYRAEIIKNGNPVRIQFGTKIGSHVAGEEKELKLFQTEGRNGKLIWKEDTN